LPSFRLNPAKFSYHSLFLEQVNTYWADSICANWYEEYKNLHTSHPVCKIRSMVSRITTQLSLPIGFRWSPGCLSPEIFNFCIKLFSKPSIPFYLVVVSLPMIPIPCFLLSELSNAASSKRFQILDAPTSELIRGRSVSGLGNCQLHDLKMKYFVYPIKKRMQKKFKSCLIFESWRNDELIVQLLRKNIFCEVL